MKLLIKLIESQHFLVKTQVQSHLGVNIPENPMFYHHVVPKKSISFKLEGYPSMFPIKMTISYVLNPPFNTQRYGFVKGEQVLGPIGHILVLYISV
jgi:hypothetical protein